MPDVLRMVVMHGPCMAGLFIFGFGGGGNVQSLAVSLIPPAPLSLVPIALCGYQVHLREGRGHVVHVGVEVRESRGQLLPDW